jgi:hypothetical protein
MRERVLAGEPTAMQIVLNRTVARGEIEVHRLSPRIASLFLDLVRHDAIMNRSPASEAALVEIVDDLFLPPRCRTLDAAPTKTTAAGRDPLGRSSGYGRMHQLPTPKQIFPGQALRTTLGRGQRFDLASERRNGKGGKLCFVTTADHLSLMVGNATNG